MVGKYLSICQAHDTHCDGLFHLLRVVLTSKDPDIDMTIKSTVPVCPSTIASIALDRSFFYGYDLSDLNLGLDLTLAGSSCSEEDGGEGDQFCECNSQTLQAYFRLLVAICCYHAGRSSPFIRP